MPSRTESSTMAAPKLQNRAELLYPRETLTALRDLFDSLAAEAAQEMKTDRRLPLTILGRSHGAAPLSSRRLYGGYLAVRVKHEAPTEYGRFAFAHVLAWEIEHGRKVPPGHIVVLLDGNKLNTDPRNLYCMPRTELAKWMRFVRCPVEVHVDKLARQIMALDTSEKVKQKLLDVLDQILDPTQTPDLMRQRAVCETVQTLVNLLRVEIAYLRAIEGDGTIPFLEQSREKALDEKAAARKRRILEGPSPSHPWRGLGSLDKD